MLGLRIPLATFALASCGRGDVVSERAQPIDARPVVAIEAYGPLVGTWSGALRIESYGLVSGVVSIDASGNGTFFVSGFGTSKSGSLRILSFGDGLVRARALGNERTVPIAVEENRLRLQIAGLGELVLTRLES